MPKHKSQRPRAPTHLVRVEEFGGAEVPHFLFKQNVVGSAAQQLHRLLLQRQQVVESHEAFDVRWKPQGREEAATPKQRRHREVHSTAFTPQQLRDRASRGAAVEGFVAWWDGQLHVANQLVAVERLQVMEDALRLQRQLLGDAVLPLS